MNLESINNRINEESCMKIINLLKDENLIKEYKQSKSVIAKINILQDILKQHNISKDINNKIANEYFTHIIPAGTKSVIKGNLLNEYIKKFIINIRLDGNIFEINFEKRIENVHTDEIPDWYILNKHSGKIIIGMNQIDLWSGGHQTNRASKYLFDNKYDENVKLLCVVCNKTKLYSYSNKKYKIFNIGFTNNTLCYINNLENIIYEFLL